MLKIMIDAGHKGKQNRGVNRAYYESERMWKLHEYLKNELSKYKGVQIGTTRGNINEDMDVTKRGKKAQGCDLMLSLHTNAVSGSKETKRVIVFRPVSGKAADLAEKLAQTVLNTMNLTKNKYWYAEAKTKKLTAKKDYYGVMRGAASVGVPCLLLEHSFHTNAEACEWLLVDDNLRRLAKAEAETIAAYYQLEKIAADAQPEESTFKPYVVSVNINNLNIRKGAGTNYAKTGKYTGKGLFTIVAEAEGKGATKWGKLKSGAGWISLDYTEFIKYV